ncbi:YybH family protein [Ohtaekwangia kribbensis]|jgi:ketosteroid isomerase-like protein|uniref:YybH family protein n=1 Tax=Ohtaekwangia kribbensis TaxID=688913 RepID=A0ABW3KCL9_9BACT
MKQKICVLIFVLFTITTASSQEKDTEAFNKLRADLAQAFVAGDVQMITAYHHPNVVKALAFDRLLIGRDANISELKGTLQSYSMKFKEHKIESFEIHGETATEISTFTIEGTPKGDGKPFIFKGRSLVLYIRYKESPSGWALIREMIQAE